MKLANISSELEILSKSLQERTLKHFKTKGLIVKIRDVEFVIERPESQFTESLINTDFKKTDTILYAKCKINDQGQVVCTKTN